MSIRRRIRKLKEYFESRDDVPMAFLFGSFAKGFETEESDVDVAVYLNDKTKEDKIRFEIGDILEKEVDLVCLNEAPASLISNIFKTGVPLTIKDKNLYWKLNLEKSLEAEDFLHFAQDYLAIYRKAKSLIPEEKIRLLERIQFLESELKELKEFKKISFREYQEEKAKRREIERWTENIINAAIDIAKIILASEKKRMPKSYEMALFDFGILAGFSQEESKKFADFAGLRNILAHEYMDILYEKIRDFIENLPQFHRRIFDYLERYLKQ